MSLIEWLQIIAMTSRKTPFWVFWGFGAEHVPATCGSEEFPKYAQSLSFYLFLFIFIIYSFIYEYQRRRRMARRKFIRRRGFKRKRRSFRKFKRGGRFAKKVKKVVQRMAEHKYQETMDNNGVSFTNIAPVITKLAYPAIGSVTDAREGDQITLRQVIFKIRVRNSNSSDPPSQWIRVLVFVWMDDQVQPLTNANIPGNVLEVPSSGGNQASLYSGWDRQNVRQKRLIPLYDKLCKLNYASSAAGTAVATTAPTERVFTFKLYGKKLPKKKITFAAGSTSSNINYYVYIQPTNVTLGALIYDSFSKFTFTDV